MTQDAAKRATVYFRSHDLHRAIRLKAAHLHAQGSISEIVNDAVRMALRAG
jgi:hypothetical protein